MEHKQSSLKKLSWSRDKLFLGFGTSPEADWRVIMLAASALIVLVVALCVFIFIKIDKGEIFAAETTEGQNEKMLDLDVLRETVSYYRNKAQVFEKIKNLAISTVDPSL